MRNQDIHYVVVHPKEDRETVLEAFKHCAEAAETLEQFRALTTSTLAHPVPFQTYIDGKTAIEHLKQGGHLFMIHRKSGQIPDQIGELPHLTAQTSDKR